MAICTSTEVINRLVAYVRREKLSKNALAERAELHDTTLRYFGTDRWNPTLRVLRKIESVVPSDFDPKAKKQGRAKNGEGA